MIFTKADINPGMKGCAALTNQDVPRTDGFPGIPFYPQTLGLWVAPVA